MFFENISSETCVEKVDDGRPSIFVQIWQFYRSVIHQSFENLSDGVHLVRSKIFSKAFENNSSRVERFIEVLSWIKIFSSKNNFFNQKLQVNLTWRNSSLTLRSLRSETKVVFCSISLSTYDPNIQFGPRSVTHLGRRGLEPVGEDPGPKPRQACWHRANQTPDRIGTKTKNQQKQNSQPQRGRNWIFINYKLRFS